MTRPAEPEPDTREPPAQPPLEPPPAPVEEPNKRPPETAMAAPRRRVRMVLH